MDRVERRGSVREAFFDRYFPRPVQILDCQHVAGHRAGLASLVRPGPPGEKLLAGWCHTLKPAGGAQLVKVLER